MNPISSKYSRQSGFTLIETLVALALLSLMTVFATGAITIMSRARHAETRITERSNFEAVERHLTQTLSDMRTLFAISQDQSAQLVFAGGPKSITFVAPLSDRLERGGLYWLRYDVDDSGIFTLNYQIFRPQKSYGAGKSEPLLQGVKGVNFSYFGSSEKGALASWSNHWPRKDILPQAVSVRFELYDHNLKEQQMIITKISGEN